MRSSPSRAVIATLFAALVFIRCGTWAADVLTVPRADPGRVTWEQDATLRNVLRRLHDGEHARMRALFPEGGLFSLSFTGFALTRLALTANDDARRREAQRELLWILARTEEERDVEPFSLWGTSTSRGVIFAGHQNLLRAGYVMVGGRDDATVDAFHRESERLARAFDASPAGLLESYPHQVWPVDNLAALESLRLHDVVYGTHLAAPPIARLVAWERAHLDKATGMMVSETDVDGRAVRDGPRGCSLSWSLAFLPALDPALAADQWQRYRAEWAVDVVGMIGFREWPPGVDKPMDDDSGPIVHGIGAAASAFGVAAATAMHDDDTAAAMVLALEALTAPGLTLHGDKEVLGGAVVLADALSLWARTQRRWDEPAVATGSGFAAAAPRAASAILVLVLLLPPAGVAVLARRAWRRRANAA